MKKCMLWLLFLVIFLNKTTAQNILSDGLLVYYPLNGNANDSSGNGNNGSAVGLSLTTDRKGNPNSAFYFSGNNSYITFSAQSLLNNNYTYAFWIKFTSIPNESGTSSFVISIGNDGGDQAIGICKDCPGGEGWNFISYPSISYLSGTLPTVGVWYHIVGTRANENVKFYINGTTTGGAGLNTSPFYATPAIAIIGSRFNGSSPFNGTLDDLRIYNRALSKEEVSELYSIATSDSTGVSQDPTITGNLPQTTSSSFRLFPNPSNGTMNINSLDNTTIKNVEIKTMMGDAVNFSWKNLNSQASLDLQSLSKGVYSLTIFTENNTFKEKIIVE